MRLKTMFLAMAARVIDRAMPVEATDDAFKLAAGYVHRGEEIFKAQTNAGREWLDKGRAGLESTVKRIEDAEVDLVQRVRELADIECEDDAVSDAISEVLEAQSVVTATKAQAIVEHAKEINDGPDVDTSDLLDPYDAQIEVAPGEVATLAVVPADAVNTASGDPAATDLGGDSGAQPVGQTASGTLAEGEVITDKPTPAGAQTS